jgi:predicted  nucleic acid-binding Zn-ribbon protein
MTDILKLLEAQKTDKERLMLIRSVEQGSIKRELDSAAGVLAEAKTKLLALEADAKTLQDNFARICRVLDETVNLVNKEKDSGGEDIAEFGSFLSRLSIMESQLADMERKIGEKMLAFENARVSGAKAQRIVQTATETFQKQKLSIKNKLDELDAKFESQIKGLDERLVAKYRAIRRQTDNDVKDIVVPVTADRRCGGCFMEISLSHISKISADGWALCEECGRMVYKDANVK